MNPIDLPNSLEPDEQADLDLNDSVADFPVVGFGASAGGMEAFAHVLEHFPADTGMAFVLVQHLDPTHDSILSELLARRTKMWVGEAVDGVKLERNHVYVIPPNKDMTLLDGHLKLAPRSASRGRHMPIDSFFSSLAEVQHSRAIGVVLSGTATDGTIGLKAIKAEGGVTFAQQPNTAKHDGMPRSAIASGHVDYVLTPEEIAQELARIAGHPYFGARRNTLPKSGASSDEESIDFKKIFSLLKRSTGVDFTYYRHSTIQRRIARRMLVHKCETLENYVCLLMDNPSELEALYHDILIKVTRFFRDPEVFEFLTNNVFPNLLKERSPESPLRVWIPGCATGEEVYSLAICLLEFMSEVSANPPMQIFATDVSEKAISTARDGKYLENIAQDVSPERLRRFFVKIDEGYQISKPIRDICIFARQNMISDPPFSKLDLISCRNVLIYLEPTLQKRVMPLFHYALKPSGYLILGTSETVGPFAEIFAQIDKRQKVYSKKLGGSNRLNVGFPTTLRGESDRPRNPETEPHRSEGFSLADARREADRIILDRYSAAGVMIDGTMEVMQFRGDTRAFLEHAPGEPSLNLLKLARDGLGLELRALVHEAKSKNGSATKSGILVSDGQMNLNLKVEAIALNTAQAKNEYFLVLFEDQNAAVQRAVRAPATVLVPLDIDRQISHLKNELSSTKQHLQSIIEEQEATNEELQSANEEILSSNEELQSINEELETAKEELQSTNEELTTVNEELHSRNSELNHLNNDLSNLLSSVSIPILMLGNDLRIRRFTPQAEKLLSLIPTDLGRPIGDIKPRINLPDLEQVVSEVIDTMALKEFEAQDREGRWYSIRIRPYKTQDNKIDGAVIAIVDIDQLKRSLEQSREANELAEAVVQTVREPLLILKSGSRVMRANRSFYECFHVSPTEVENRVVYDLGNGQWNIPRLRELLEDLLSKNKMLTDYLVEHTFDKIGHRKMLLNARRIELERDNGTLILLAIEDVTLRKDMV